MALPNDTYLQATAGGATTDLQPSGTASKGSSRYLAKLDHVHPATNSIANDFAAGTIAAPGFAVSTDTDSGLAQVTANTLSLAAGGKESVRALAGTGTVVNYVTTAGSAASSPVIVAADGTDSAIGINVAPKGAASTSFGTIGTANGALVLNQSTSGTTTITSAATGTNAITLPSGTVTLATLAGSEALTGKTINGLTVATSTGTLTVPNGVTLTGPASSGTAATLAGTETLTNKTLTGSIDTDMKRCSASVTANGTITYANVTGLSVTVVPGTYKFRAVLPSTVASGTGGIKYCFNYTTTVMSSIEATGMGYTASAVAVQHTTTTTTQTDLFTQAAVVIMTILEGTCVVGTGGTVDLQMAQNTSNASNSITLIGSSLDFTRIA